MDVCELFQYPNQTKINQMEKRTLQIDVIGPLPTNTELIECNIYIDGRCCRFWTTKANYEALMYDKVFIRDGKEKDSAGVLNTTNTFFEKPDYK
jgi:hypothetical protein